MMMKQQRLIWIAILLVFMILIETDNIYAFATTTTTSSISSTSDEEATTTTTRMKTCSIENEGERDPALQEFTYDVGNGPETIWAYVERDVASFYRQEEEEEEMNRSFRQQRRTKVVPKHTGLAGKYVNLSNETIRVYWEASIGHPNPTLMSYLAPMETDGTATFTGHYFFFAKEHGDPVLESESTVVKRITVQAYPNNYLIYDPYTVPDDPEATERNVQEAFANNEEQRKQYQLWKQTLLFNEQYLNFTGRTYLASYLREPPIHHIWRADYLGQQHWVTTRETHFQSLPTEEEEEESLLLQPIQKKGIQRKLQPTEPRLLQEYRVHGNNTSSSSSSILNMTLTVLSCAPRVFEIRNFLSQVEVDHILQLAGGIQLSRSSVGQVGSRVIKETKGKSETRTSRNSWVNRETSPIIDAIYRRAADLLRIDESLFRHRDPIENNHLQPSPSKPVTTTSTLAEHLQLVHYSPGQEYTAHHDFGFSRPNTTQGARFSTLLLYLNEDMKGGETSFPRWQNAETFDQLRVAPETGKAVLFYSQLPDGNLDDFSHHAALPVREGEKWLINLWVWDPIYARK